MPLQLKLDFRALATALVGTAALAVISPGLSWAEPVATRIEGTVDLVQPVGTEVLKELGVVSGAPATIVFEVEADTPANAMSSTSASYLSPVTNWTLTIDQFEAHVSDEFPNAVGLLHAAGSQDQYTATGILEVDSDGGSMASVVMAFSDPEGDAISEIRLVQDFNPFAVGQMSVVSEIGSFTLDLGASEIVDGEPGPEPEQTAKCARSQIVSGADLAEARLACAAKAAKKLAFDGAACIDEASRQFAGAFDAAIDDADASEDAVCASGVSGEDAVEELANEFSPLDEVISKGADETSKADRKYRSDLYAASARAARVSLRAYAKDAKKPNAKKLRKRLDKSDASLRKDLKKARKRARSRGITANVDRGLVVERVGQVVRRTRDVARGTR